MEHHETQDDFEESLVRSVIEEWVVLIIYSRGGGAIINFMFIAVHSLHMQSPPPLFRNPAEEQGVRDEWKRQTGWHRKEDIYLRRRQRHPNQTYPDPADVTMRERGDNEPGNNARSNLQNKNIIADDNQQYPTQMHAFNNHDTLKVCVMLGMVISSVLCIRTVYSNHSWKHTRRRGERKKIEDLVWGLLNTLASSHFLKRDTKNCTVRDNRWYLLQSNWMKLLLRHFVWIALQTAKFL